MVDQTLEFLADPYRFISRRCKEEGRDVFETRIMFQRTLCMSGPQAAQIFYDKQRFAREGAAPEPLQASLFGKGGVQALDGAAHLKRKALFLTMLSTERVSDFVVTADREWSLAVQKWTQQERMALYPALREWLTRAACLWANVPLAERDVHSFTRDLSALFDKAAAFPGGNVRARLARWRLEGKLTDFIESVRNRRTSVSPDSAAWLIAWHTGDDGQLLPSGVAAVELLNVIRPIVAVSVFAVDVAHALHHHPEWRIRLQGGQDDLLDAFIQEVRRWYPFFPVVAAKVADDFEWQGYRFKKERRVMLDLYGTNRDDRTWSDADKFRPERFLERTPTAFELVPQGGADAEKNHRCPGEGIAMALMKFVTRKLVNSLRYEVADQDLSIDYGRLPAIPRDGFVIEQVALVNQRAGVKLNSAASDLLRSPNP